MECTHRRQTHLAAIAVSLVLLLGWASSAGAATLHRSVGPEPDALDIHLAQSLSAINVLRDLHLGLVGLDAQARAVPGIAKSWSVDERALVWTFELEEGARWSDGTPIVADDFVAGWRRAVEPATGSPVAGLLEPIENARAIRRGRASVETLGVQALGPHRLEVTLEQPTPWFEELLTHPVMAPWPGQTPRFSGAYTLVERLPGAHLRLRKNPHHLGADQVAIDEVMWHVIEQPSVELSRFRAGQLDITETIPPGRVDWLKTRMGASLRIAPYLGSFFLAFNVAHPTFKDQVALREALSLVIDRKRLTQQVLGAGEQPAYALIPPSLPGWTPPAPFTDLPHAERIDKAQALYAQAGYSQDKPLKVELRFNTSLNHRRMAAAVGAMWREHLGVHTRLVNEEWKVFVTNRRQGRITQVVRGGWIGDWQDPANFLQLFVSDSPLNYSFWQDARFDRLIERANTQTGSARLATLAQAEQRLIDQHVIIPLYYYVSRHLVQPNVKGWEDNLMDIHLSKWLSLE